jgi:hypothetical protein
LGLHFQCLLIEKGRLSNKENNPSPNRHAYGDRRCKNMDISRKLGILVFFGVPAIIGGGIVYGAAGNYLAVAAYEIVLYIVAGAIISK